MQKSRFWIYLLCGSALSLSAHSQQVNVSGWTATGFVLPAAPIDVRSITLPPGGDVFRRLAGGAIVLSTESLPVFADAEQDWPVLQFAAVSFAFVRQGNSGRVYIVTSEGRPELLPVEFPLNESGRAAQSINLVIGTDPANAAIIYSVGGYLRAISGQANPGAEVSLASGTSSSWEISSLKLVALSEIPVAENSGAFGGTASTSGSADAFDQVVAALATKPTITSMPDTAVNDATAKATGAVSSRPAPLETFTPPAARRSPAEIRAAIGRTLNR